MTRERRPRLIASDLDGTFLSPDGTVSDVNAAAVAQATTLEVPFVFATGRPSRWLDCLQGVSRAQPLVVVSNGAAVFDSAAGRLSRIRAIDPDTALTLTATMRSLLPGIVFGFEYPEGFACEPSLPPDESIFFTSGEVWELVGLGQIMKLLVFSTDFTSEQLHGRLAPALDGQVEATYSATSTTGILELMAPGVTKASTLAELCSQHGIESADVAAFGDMPNDMAMLDWAGMPYRMTDGHRQLAQRGYPLAGSNADSGVGRTVLRLLSLDER